MTTRGVFGRPASLIDGGSEPDVKFTAKWAGYQLFVREEERQFYADGRSRVITPPIYVEFAEQALDIETYQGVDSEDSSTFPQLRGGGYYDTEVAQRDKRWTDEERELVEERLLDIAENGPRADEYRMMRPADRPSGFGDVKLYETPKPVAPFQNYDNLSADKIIRISSELDCAERSLAYERVTKNRKSVIEPLLELIDMKQAEQELTAAS